MAAAMESQNTLNTPKLKHNKILILYNIKTARDTNYYLNIAIDKLSYHLYQHKTKTGESNLVQFYLNQKSQRLKSLLFLEVHTQTQYQLILLSNSGEKCKLPQEHEFFLFINIPLIQNKESTLSLE